MTFPSDHLDSSPREDLPQGLQGDLKRAYGNPDIQPPSRVDDAVFAAAAKHFGEVAAASPASQAEPKPGVLARLGRKPLQTAGLAGALLAASVLLIVFIGGPSPRPTADERSVAMDAFSAPESPSLDDTAQGIARSAELDPVFRTGGSMERPRREGEEMGAMAMDALPRDADLRTAELADTKSDAMLPVMPPPPAAAMPETVSILRADVNGDGSVNIADALLLARMVDDAGGSLDDLRYDLLGNGTVSRADADEIARIVVRLATPPEDPNTEGAS